MVAHRFEVWHLNLDPAIGKEIKIQVLSDRFFYPTRIHYVFQRKKDQVAIDQIRSLDKSRLVKKAGTLNEQVCKTLLEFFAFE